MAETKDWHLKMREPLQKEEIFPSSRKLNFFQVAVLIFPECPGDWFDRSKTVEGWCFPPRLMPMV